MAKPTTSPAWADDAAATKTDPGAVKRALGWLFGEPPPSSFVNWWMNLVGDWIDYLDDQGVIQYTSLSSLVAATSTDKVAILSRASSVEQWSTQWTKSPTQIGGASFDVAALATDGVSIFCASTTVGGDTHLKAFNLITGVETWGIATGVATTTLFLHSDGRFLVWGQDDAGAKAAKVYDLADGTLLNTIAVTNLVDGFSDGDQLYLVSTNATYIDAYSDYSLTGAEVLEWSDATVRATLGAVRKVVTDGVRVFVGTVTNGNHLLIYERDGTFVAVDDPEATTIVQIEQMKCDEDYLYLTTDTDDLLIYPTSLQDPVGAGAYPGTLATTQMNEVGTLAKITIWGKGINGLSAEYAITVEATGQSVRVVRTPTMSGGATADGGGPAVAFIEDWDSALVDAVLSTTHFAYGGLSNAAGKVLACRNLPQKGGQMLKRVDPATNFRRAPLWMGVKEVTG